MHQHNVYTNYQNNTADNCSNTTIIITTPKVIWQKAESVWKVHPTPLLYSPGGSIGLTVCLQFATACFAWGLDPQIFPSPGGQGPPSNTMCHWTPQVYLPNVISIRQTV